MSDAKDMHGAKQNLTESRRSGKASQRPWHLKYFLRDKRSQQSNEKMADARGNSKHKDCWAK